MRREQKASIGRFDQVLILTTKNVSYVSYEEERPEPIGLWTVTGIVGTDLLISRGDVLIRIPSKDVVKKVDYESTLSDLYKKLGNLTQDGQRQKKQD